MLEKINKKLEKETNKILEKEELSNEDMIFLFNQRTRLEALEEKEEVKAKEIEQQEKMKNFKDAMTKLTF